MTDREKALASIGVDDIFHATAPNGASLICLAHRITETAIEARSVTSQFDFAFDRVSGIADWSFERNRVACTIDSVAPLPAVVHEIVLGLDRKYAPSQGERDSRLSPDEIAALLFVARFYPAHPLTPPWQEMSIGRAVTVEPEREDDELTEREKTDRILAAFLIPAPRPDREQTAEGDG